MSDLRVLPGRECRVLSERGIVFPFGVAVASRNDREPIFVADTWSIREFDRVG